MSKDRPRTHSLPTRSPNSNQENFSEAENSLKEMATNGNMEPSTTPESPSEVARREISEALELSKRLSASVSNVPSRPPSVSSEDGKRTPPFGIVNSIYSLGSSVWGFIRGPVEADSADNLDQFALNRVRKIATANEDSDSDSSINSDGKSPGPDFDFVDKEKLSRTRLYTLASDADSLKSLTKLSVAEPGRSRQTIHRVSIFDCKLIGRDFPTDEHLLSVSDIATIQSAIPPRFKLHSHWVLLYSTRGNGFSLVTLYHQAKGFRGPVILAIKDDSDGVFGAFLNQTIQPRPGHYGTGESFLWRHDNEQEGIVKFPSTGKNNYFIISEMDYFAVGCGDGKFGLWFDKDLLKGTSDPVPTFDNEQLSPQQQFECLSVEIWGLLLDE